MCGNVNIDFNRLFAKLNKVRDDLAHAAAEGDNAAIIKILDQHPSLVNSTDVAVYVPQTPLMHAAANGHIDTMKLLIARGAGVNNTVNTVWGSATVVAAENGQTEALKLLIKEGADLNSKDGIGSALLAATWKLHVDTVKLLIANGADVNRKDSQGNTVLETMEKRLAMEIQRKDLKEEVRTDVLRKTREIIDILKKGAPPKLKVVPKTPKL